MLMHMCDAGIDRKSVGGPGAGPARAFARGPTGATAGAGRGEREEGNEWACGSATSSLSQIGAYVASVGSFRSSAYQRSAPRRRIGREDAGWECES